MKSKVNSIVGITLYKVYYFYLFSPYFDERRTENHCPRNFCPFSYYLFLRL